MRKFEESIFGIHSILEVKKNLKIYIKLFRDELLYMYVYKCIITIWGLCFKSLAKKDLKIKPKIRRRLQGNALIPFKNVRLADILKRLSLSTQLTSSFS